MIYVEDYRLQSRIKAGSVRSECCNETKEFRRPAAARRPGARPGGPGDACSPASTPPTFVATYATHY